MCSAVSQNNPTLDTLQLYSTLSKASPHKPVRTNDDDDKDWGTVVGATILV